jgi:hypothetical protein
MNKDEEFDSAAYHQLDSCLSLGVEYNDQDLVSINNLDDPADVSAL